MPIYYVILIVLIAIIIISALLKLLFNPFVWVVIAILAIYSAIRKYLYDKEVESRKKETKNEHRSSQQTYYHHQNDDDIIDVDYKIVDEEKKDN